MVRAALVNDSLTEAVGSQGEVKRSGDVVALGVANYGD